VLSNFDIVVYKSFGNGMTIINWFRLIFPVPNHQSDSDNMLIVHSSEASHMMGGVPYSDIDETGDGTDGEVEVTRYQTLQWALVL